MSAGKFRHKIKIEQPGTTKDDAGQVLDTWSTHIERFAEIVNMSGRELFVSQQRFPEVDTRITLRIDSKSRRITQKMRVKFEDLRAGSPVIEKIYNIIGVMDDIPDQPGEMRLMTRLEGLP